MENRHIEYLKWFYGQDVVFTELQSDEGYDSKTEIYLVTRNGTYEIARVFNTGDKMHISIDGQIAFTELLCIGCVGEFISKAIKSAER